MFNPDPMVYEFTRNAWEKFRQEEGLPVKSMPGLISYFDEVLDSVRWLAQVLRCVLRSHKPGGQRQLHPAGQGNVAK